MPRSWNVFIGKDPRTVTGPAIVFFPVQDTLCCCGLAGFVCIRRAEAHLDMRITDRIARAVDTVCAGGVSALIAGKIPKQS
ncbi:MAG TPA: hypothetical protein PLB09_12400, partial [Deltaproteobacteria bacterium]|nr:hypothetical protein [Deltaproteobacteria bacterium]